MKILSIQATLGWIAAGLVAVTLTAIHWFGVALPADAAIVHPKDALEFWTLMAGVGALATAAFTLLLVVVAGIGLRSLTLTRRDMVTRATREARTCTVARCLEFGSEIIPINTVLRLQLPDFVTDAKNVVFDDPREDSQRTEAKAWSDGLARDLHNNAVALLNRLESWSMYFTKELADDAAAYEPCAPVYLAMVIQNYPLLVDLRSQAGSGQYRNVVRLFNAWVVTKDAKEQAETWEKMNSTIAETKRAVRRAKLNPPLGTEN